MTITPSAIIPSSRAILRSATAAEAITAGKLVYRATIKTVGVADASVSARSQVAGIAVCTAAAGQPVSFVERDPELEIGGAHRIGEVYVLGTSGGYQRALNVVNGWRVSSLGVVVAGTKLDFLITTTDDVRTDPTPAAPSGLAVDGSNVTTWETSGSIDSVQIQFAINASGPGSADFMNPDFDEIGAISPYAAPGLSTGSWVVRVRTIRTVSGDEYNSAWTTLEFTV